MPIPPTSPKVKPASDAPPSRSAIDVPISTPVPPTGKTVYDLIGEESQRFAHQAGPVVAHHVLTAVGVTKEQAAVLFPLVLDAVEHHRRLLARAKEDTAFGPGPRPAPEGRGVKVTAGGYEPDVAKLRVLLNETFRLGDGSDPVTWGLATKDQHNQRIAMLNKQAAGIFKTADRHRLAVCLMEQAGVDCLAEFFKKEAP
jgi:hypothetical protein